MPAYGSKNYVQSLVPGSIGFSLNADAVTTLNGNVQPASGEAFALPSSPGLGNAADGRTIRWQTLFTGTALATVSMRLQGAMRDVDAEYKDLDTDTTVTGNAKTVVGVRANFVRIQVQAQTGADATSKVTGMILP